MAKPKILALIPARSGSKGIPHKNIRPLVGKPMLAYSIEHAKQSKWIDRIIVSTDSEEYAEIARSYGAEVPFLRPKEIAKDLSTDLEVFLHTLDWLKHEQAYVPDICVHLRPTHPIREVTDIDNMIEIILNNNIIDSVRSIAPASETPYKMWFQSEESLLKPVVSLKGQEAHNLPRQQLPKVYVQNACIDVIRTSVICDKKSMTGEKIFGYKMKENFDIDSEEQFLKAEKIIMKRSYESKTLKLDLSEPRVFCFDIDGVIASIVSIQSYEKAEPIEQTIRLINYLFDHGHKIILFTARGSATGIDWAEVTRSQMEQWNVKYHELKFGKPAADYYIDDKFIEINELIKNIRL